MTLCSSHFAAMPTMTTSDIVDSSTYWARLGNIVVTWILGTLSLEHHEIVQKPTEIAHQAWLTCEAQFFGNCESRILQLGVKFHVFKQGDLSVSDYCHEMKGMVDDVHALGETITDRHLVFNIL
jgi:hypothetical protein